ncbi:MAG: hypothetical protein LBD91_07170 [Prevotellaceae bacterium]|jgi:DNA-binding LacI/PurR family transcriptional regulator|nr:hypothetical protein [Prevotellaceae bacterium]
MKKNQIPRHGWISDLAKLAGCTRQTVSKTMFENATGCKAELVRRLYRAKYINKNQ